MPEQIERESRGNMIRFETNLSKIGSRTILRLPRDASRELPSRGAVFIEGTFNDFPFKAVLEPVESKDSPGAS